MTRDGIEEALALLKEALRNHEAHSPEQLAAWESGLSKLPECLRHQLPSLANLLRLADKAWPGTRP